MVRTYENVYKNNFSGYHLYQDAFSTQDGSKILQDDDNCKYIGMTKSHQPICKEKGLLVDIQLDNGESICSIRQKRVDQVLGPWQAFTTDEKIDFKQGQKKKILVDAAHGGNFSVSKRVSVWYKFIKKKMTCDNARQHCVDLGIDHQALLFFSFFEEFFVFTLDIIK